MSSVYSKTAAYYDKLYGHKDYAGEVRRLLSYLDPLSANRTLTLLDVACGTGLHIAHLKKHFRIEGLDICDELLECARENNPGVDFHVGDMIDFHLGRRFDVVTCLFSAIGYVKTRENLYAAIANMAAHVRAGGTLVIEPWFTPRTWRPGTVHGLYIDEPDLKIARLSTSLVRDTVSVFDLHHLIGTPAGTEHIVEHHEMGLFGIEEMVAALEASRLAVRYDPDGLMGRGLYIGVKR